MNVKLMRPLVLVSVFTARQHPGRSWHVPINEKHPPEASAVEERQAIALHTCISVLMRKFRIEPGMLAGSVYADLHANDIGLFEVLAAPETWTVRRIAEALAAPLSTISSALDRLERKNLIARSRIIEDRRVVRIELTARGQHLAGRLRKAHVQNCHLMLAQLTPDQREEFVHLAIRITSS